ncbi:hypothetical protein BST79_gp271 [Only Syngen Nebraska virus 5]|uniref:hypothetical protein n=1 Tax=Only Syngen Nebraska virus 5 TaxID=1917232 RepID=UPI000901BFFC|nr:hypothetical protein BST79_gp271 [Only Syngen Nebraska virus 5]APC25784.1 hypothetical protein [Only Syngen Nebraska virus 5]
MLVHATGMTTHGAAATLGGGGATGLGGGAAGLGGSAFRRFGAASARNGASTCGGHFVVILSHKIFFSFYSEKISVLMYQWFYAHSICFQA